MLIAGRRLIPVCSLVVFATSIGLSAPPVTADTFPALGDLAITCKVAAGARPGDAVLVNITTTDAVGDGWGAVRAPDGEPVFLREEAKQYSNVNYAPNTPADPNVAVTAVGTDGKFCYDSLLASNVILDQLAVIPAANIKLTPPKRLLDTRSKRPLAAATSVCVTASNAAAGDAVLINITNTDAVADGWGALRPPSQTPVYRRPAKQQYSNVNYAPNTPPNPNVAVTAVDAKGKFCYDTFASSHVILDQLAVIPAANIKLAPPKRLLDTRTSRPLAAKSSVCVNASNTSPGDAVLINITNTDAAIDGWGALRPPSQTPVYKRSASQQYSNVNYAPNTPANPNVAVTAVGANGEFCYDTYASSNVILDQLAVIPAANVNLTPPKRLVDTRRLPGRVTQRLDGIGDVFTIECPTSSNCVMVARKPNDYFNNLIWRSSDGGRTWKKSLSSDNQWSNIDVTCTSGTRCLLLGIEHAADEQRQQPFLLETTNAGASWKRIGLPNPTTNAPWLGSIRNIDVNTIECADGTCQISGSGESSYGFTLLSKNNGKTWTVGEMLGKWTDVTRMHCVAANDCLGVGFNGWPVGTSFTWRPDEQATNWQVQADLEVAFPIGLECLSATECYVPAAQPGFFAANDSPTLRFTEDGGQTWRRISIPVEYNEYFVGGISGFTCVSVDRCVFASLDHNVIPDTNTLQNRMVIFRTLDAGLTWDRAATLRIESSEGSAQIACPTADRCLAGISVFDNPGRLVELSNLWKP